jgi:hypothetical protein
VRHAFEALPEFVRVESRIGIRQDCWDNPDADTSEIQRIKPRIVSNDQRAYLTRLDSILEQIRRTYFRGFDQRSVGPAERISIGEPMDNRILGRLPFGIHEPSSPHGRAFLSLDVGHSVRDEIASQYTIPA